MTFAMRKNKLRESGESAPSQNSSEKEMGASHDSVSKFKGAASQLLPVEEEPAEMSIDHQNSSLDKKKKKQNRDNASMHSFLSLAA